MFKIYWFFNMIEMTAFVLANVSMDVWLLQMAWLSQNNAQDSISWLLQNHPTKAEEVTITFQSYHESFYFNVFQIFILASSLELLHCSFPWFV